MRTRSEVEDHAVARGHHLEFVRRHNTCGTHVVCLWLVPMRTESVARTNETEGRRAFGGGSGHLGRP
jgi:hypothetical protein